MCIDDETVRNKLQKMRIELRDRNDRNPLYQYYAYKRIKDKNLLSATKIRNRVKELREQGYSHKAIAEDLGIDRASVARRLELM